MATFYVGQTDYIDQLNILQSNIVMPTVAGNTGKYLFTDGISTSWAYVPVGYVLPTASTNTMGGIKIDNTTLAFNGSGQLYYTGAQPGGVPVATTTTLGSVKIDGTTITISNGVISGFDGVFSNLTSKPTTISGYGITDTLTTTNINAAIAIETLRATNAEALKAPLTSPTFTGTVNGITKAMVGLGNVDNTTDLDKPVSTPTIAAIGVETTRALTAEALLAPKASPIFSGIVSGITKTMVGLGNVDNTTDLNKPVSTATNTAIAIETTRATAAETLKAPLASPTFTGTVSGITKTMVGLDNVDNTTDLNKPVSTATIAAIAVETARAQAAEAAEISRATAAEALKASLASPTFTGTVSGITKTMVGLGNVDNTTDLNKPVSTATTAAIAVETSRAIAAESLLAPQITTYTKAETDSRIQAIVGAAPAALDTLAEIAAQLVLNDAGAGSVISAISLKAPIESPTFTGTVNGISKAMVGLGNVDNTNDLLKPVSTATTAAIAVETARASAAEILLAPITSPTFFGTVSGITKTMVGLGNVDNTTDLLKPVSTATTAAIAVETARATAAEALNAPLASPTFTGTVSGITKTMVGLDNVDNTTDLLKPVSTATTAAIAVETTRATAAETLKAPLASPTFTGTVSGITKTMVGLGNVDNTTDLLKPVSTATTTAIAVETTRATAAEILLAPKASPIFSGIVTGSAYQEYYTSPTIVSNAVTLDYSQSAIFYFTGITANFAANFINVPTTANYINTVTLVIVQGGTVYLPSSIKINTVTQTIKWQNATAATGAANRVNLLSLSFIETATSTWTVLGSITSYA